VPFIAEGLAAINAGLKAIELWEKFGPVASDGIQTLNLVYDPSEFHDVAAKIETSLDGEYEELFKGTKDRVGKCIKALSEAAGADDNIYLPEQRRKFGKAARSCVCREISILDDFMVGELPDELKAIWQKHKCAEARAPMASGA
jgi:hypothetical protein